MSPTRCCGTGREDYDDDYGVATPHCFFVSPKLDGEKRTPTSSGEYFIDTRRCIMPHRPASAGLKIAAPAGSICLTSSACNVASTPKLALLIDEAVPPSILSYCWPYQAADRLIGEYHHYGETACLRAHRPSCHYEALIPYMPAAEKYCQRRAAKCHFAR